MQINGSIPFHVARAYGVLPSRAASPAASSSGAPVAAPSAPSAPRAPDGREPSAKLQQLVAARVDTPVDFTGGRDSSDSLSMQPIARAATGAYQLYTRAADRIEAAVGIQIGRSIDVKG